MKDTLWFQDSAISHWLPNERKFLATVSSLLLLGSINKDEELLPSIDNQNSSFIKSTRNKADIDNTIVEGNQSLFCFLLTSQLVKRLL